MKLKDIALIIIKSDEFKDEVVISGIAEKVFGYDFSVFNYYDKAGKIQDRLVSYFYRDWYDTDTRVGDKVYYFDNELVAISSRSSRRNSEFFRWLSLEAFNTVKDYVNSFRMEEEFDIPLISEDDDIQSEYKIHFYNGMFEHNKNNVSYKNKDVKVVKPAPFGYVTIEFEDGTIYDVEPKYLDFKLNIK